MFSSREQRSLSRCVAFEFIGDDHSRHVGQSFEQPTKERLCGAFLSAALLQDIEHVPLLIDCPPQLGILTLDRQKHLIEVPLITRPGTAATELIGIRLATLATPFPNRFLRHEHATFTQQLFDIAEAQTKPKVPPHRVADDFHRNPVSLIGDGGG